MNKISFIKVNFPKKLKLFVNKKNSPTILKTRFIDYLNSNKILGTYKFNDDLVNSTEEKKLIHYYYNSLKKMI